ncbi:MAG: Hpt domain-containing protein [Proteobacteria bacterium]|nr:Hpt domain-containing protein [Pseudomonadota bacterium]
MEDSPFGFSLEDFRDEARELLDRMEDILPEISASSDSQEGINALFRAVHSLKGSAGYAGLKSANSFAHLYENLLADLRNKRRGMDEAILRILIRSKDYLEDLVFSSSPEDLPGLDEMEGDSASLLSEILRSKQKQSPPSAAPASAKKVAENAPVQPEKPLPADPMDMDEGEVVRVGVMSGLKKIAAALKETPIDADKLSGLLVSMEATLLWAFGDENPELVEPLSNMHEMLARAVGTKEASGLIKNYNRIVKAVKSELAPRSTNDLPGKSEKEDTASEGPKKTGFDDRYSTDDIRGATEGKILELTIDRSFSEIEEVLEQPEPDLTVLKKSISRLKDLNDWAFRADEEAGSLLSDLDNMLLRLRGASAIQEMTRKVLLARDVFSRLHNEESGTPESVTLPAAFTALPAHPTPSVARRPLASDSKAGPSLRVKIEDIDTLMEMVGKLEGVDLRDLEQLQGQALQLRMVPVGELFSRFRKIVRDISDELDKDIDLLVSGESVRLDKVIVDKMQEPLLHLVRNSASHGIESREERQGLGKGRGTISLNAYQEGGQIIIEVSDNGRGISLDKVRAKAVRAGLIEDRQSGIDDKDLIDLIFSAGFSTREEADSVSGRGVGLDVVRESISSLQGTVDVETAEGKGALFRMVLPLTQAIVKSLVLEEGGRRIALPAASVEKVIILPVNDIREKISNDEGRVLIKLKEEGGTFQCVDFSRLFGSKSVNKKRCIVLAKAGFDKKIALLIDNAVERLALVVQPLDAFAANRYFSSAAIVKENLVLMLNLPNLLVQK